MKALQEMPHLFMHLGPFWQAFELLSTSRTFTMGGQGPIPLSEVLAYLEWDGVLDKREQRRYVHYLRAMDAAYLAMVNKRDND